MDRRTAPVLAAAFILIAAAPASAQGSGKGWAGEIWPRGGGADSNAAGSSGAGLLDGALSYSFENGITGKAEAEGNALLGGTGTGGKLELWWQDPTLALLGVKAETARRDGLWQRRYIVHGELYVGPITLRAQSGYVPSDRTDQGQIEGGFFGLASAGYYPLDSLGLNLGGATQAGSGLGFGNVEWAPGFMPPGSSLTLDGGAGRDGFLIGVVGVRFTFGPGAGNTVRGRQAGSAPGFPALVIGAFGDTRQSASKPSRNPNSPYP
ncbi:MAG: hypothetical protein MUC89_06360 [Acetobacteraceae bacterium]|jgi:hypothetical protein|nr:hypothetical protein [Acetobacteraceae bacterium]